VNQIEKSNVEAIEEKLAESQALTWVAVAKIAEQIKPGMTELEAIRMGQKTLAELGCKKFWHKCHIRFGRGTVCSFEDEYADHVLGVDDIFYVDIGPIWNGIEGDAGATFVTGNNHDYVRCRNDVKLIFNRVAQAWRNQNLTGIDLYHFAEQEAKDRGWELAPSYVRGHRLSEFPHSFYSEAMIDALDFCPAPQRWMLEIHICDKNAGFGAFYEDILK
jgi:Xaa-Pro aminopeptidase